MQTICARNHIYDSDQYATCPYCNRNARSIHFGAANGQTGFDRTTAPSGGADMPKTSAPGMNNGNDNIGKTEIPDYMKERLKKEEQDRTVAIYKQVHGIDPVVGWLVCIEGTEKGKDYRLLNRINTIGRGANNDVVLEFERTVSQINHARLAYDEKHNNFQIIPGDGRNVVYVNDAPLFMPQKLNAYDILEFGETKLLFVPLCGEHFKWGQEAK